MLHQQITHAHCELHHYKNEMAISWVLEVIFVFVRFRLFNLFSYLFIYFTYFYFTSVRRNNIVFSLYLHLRLCSTHKCEPGLRSGG